MGAHMRAAARANQPPASRLVAGHQIEGVELRLLDMRRDQRGSFTEVFQADWQSGIAPVQWSVVHSRAGVFRGMHLHRRHDEYFAVVSGRASVGLRDIRPRSATLEAWSLYELSDTELACLIFPSGLLHGWYFHEASIHLQAVSEPYSDYAGDDNWGCRWSDPALEIPWPFTDEPIVTERAQTFPSLDELVVLLGTWKEVG